MRDSDVDMIMVVLVPAHIIETAGSVIELNSTLENAEGKNGIRGLPVPQIARTSGFTTVLSCSKDVSMTFAAP